MVTTRALRPAPRRSTRELVSHGRRVRTGAIGAHRAVMAEAIIARTSAGATLRLRRVALSPDAGLAWSLCGSRAYFR